MKRASFRKAAFVLAVLVSSSLAATAQTVIDFNSLPKTNRYLPIPYGFGGTSWGNLNYITTSVNGSLTNVGAPAFNSSAQTFSAASPGQSFQLASLMVSEQNSVVLTAHGYNQGVHVGSRSYLLSANPTAFTFPSSWGNLTSVTLVCETHFGNPAQYMLYSVSLR
jgi:hypothetical protein